VRFRRISVESNDATAFSLPFARSERIADYRGDATISGRRQSRERGDYYPDMRLLPLTVKPVLANSCSLHQTSSRVSPSPAGDRNRISHVARNDQRNRHGAYTSIILIPLPSPLITDSAGRRSSPAPRGAGEGDGGIPSYSSSTSPVLPRS